MNLLAILLIIILIFVLLYLIMIIPRFRKPDCSSLMGYHYAHRGFHDLEHGVPENSLTAFQRAVDKGYGIELDVQLSGDGVAVVFHDSTLTRMCGVEKKVNELTLAELKELSLAGTDERIPTFKEFLNLVDGKVPLVVEIKMDKKDDRIPAEVNRLLSDYKGVYCIESFHPSALIWYKKNRPDIVRGQLSMEFWKDEANKDKKYLILLAFLVSNVASRPDFIAYQHSDYKNLSRRLCKMMGALSVTWTIKSVEQYEKVKDEFDLFIFDSCRL